MTQVNLFTKMLRKTFVLTMFGSTFDWMPQFIDHVQHLKKDGWYWKIFTPNDLSSKGNVEVVSMTTDQFNDLVAQKLGVMSHVFMTDRGVPSVHMTDYYVATGVIFEDYLKDSDYWGITNPDIVYGNLSKFVPDSELNGMWTDDTSSFNGIFSLMKNTEFYNNLFKNIPNWQTKLSAPPCPKCLTGEGQHSLFGTDEYDMSERIKNMDIGRPKWYPIHSHDRLEQHTPNPKLEIKEDGSLWELFEDINGPQWIHARPFIGKEIPYFHFPRTKKWPL